MGQRKVVVQLTESAYECLAEAARLRGWTLSSYLVWAGIKSVELPELPSHVQFAGTIFRAEQVPSEWRRQSDENQLLTLLKRVLREGKLEAAGAMVVELMNYPREWEDVRLEEEQQAEEGRPAWHVDPELAQTVKEAFPSVALSADADVWSCYKAIAYAAPGRPVDEHVTPPASTN